MATTHANDPAETGTDTQTVFELYNNRASSQGLFRSLEGAQAHASTVHQGYIDLVASLTEDERNDTEPVFAELTWCEERATIGRDTPIGEPRPTAHYSERGTFHITARELRP